MFWLLLALCIHLLASLAVYYFQSWQQLSCCSGHCGNLSYSAILSNLFHYYSPASAATIMTDWTLTRCLTRCAAPCCPAVLSLLTDLSFLSSFFLSLFIWLRCFRVLLVVKRVMSCQHKWSHTSCNYLDALRVIKGNKNFRYCHAFCYWTKGTSKSTLSLYCLLLVQGCIILHALLILGR